MSVQHHYRVHFLIHDERLDTLRRFRLLLWHLVGHIPKLFTSVSKTRMLTIHSFIGWVFVLFCYPECKGMPLEAVREVFKDGFGVRYSKQWQKENKHMAKVTTQSFGH